jgi:glycosyltransferase involved in cell wall biosynthesis
MRIACTGFLSQQAGSIAAANALLLRTLLDRNIEVEFFSKPSFVDPRPVVGSRRGFRFIPVTNHLTDSIRAKAQRVVFIRAIAGHADSVSYNRMLVRRIRQEHQLRSYDLCLWLGDYAWGSMPGIPTVSFVQGPPGTDARSVLEKSAELQTLCGSWQTLKWRTLARLRLSPIGLPRFHHSDYFIVGSEQSRRTLRELYGIDSRVVSVVPYPIDLSLFYPEQNEADPKALRVLWLGRIVPRKRLDIFLEGAALAIQRDLNVKLTIVGPVGFIGGYDRLIDSFPFPDRLQWVQSMPRTEVPALLRRYDVLAQPSDEENFGSSVAEAQACGLPVIVGATNGNSDYLCSRDIHLKDDKPETFARALAEMSARKALGKPGGYMESRRAAEEHFHIDRVVDLLIEVLDSALACSNRAPVHQSLARDRKPTHKRGQGN